MDNNLTTNLITTSHSIQVMRQINEVEAKNWLKGWLEPITSLLLWVIPLVAVISILIVFIGWYGKDEREKRQQPFFKTIKTHLIVLAVAESFTTILKILGL